jgi:hypothetical protein
MAGSVVYSSATKQYDAEKTRNRDADLREAHEDFPRQAPAYPADKCRGRRGLRAAYIASYLSMSIGRAIRAIEAFQGKSLTANLACIEREIGGHGVADLKKLCAGRSLDHAFMASAVSIKKVAGQINVIIHAAGILCALPHILERDEKVESVSLGAGNTGRKFDLETSLRVAEFKFIDWRGGAESIRQNSVFKDFYDLAEYRGRKRRYLYVVDTTFPLKFLGSGRALSSVLSRAPRTQTEILEKYGPAIRTVRDYYELKKRKVEIVDISSHIGRDV